MVKGMWNLLGKIAVLLAAISTEVVAEKGSSLCFPVIGDFGGVPFAPYSTFTQRKIGHLMSKMIERLKCQFIIALGDNFYHSGVKHVNDPRFNLTFEKIYATPQLHIPWYLIAGNHDHASNVSAQIAYTHKSARWNFPYYYHSKVHAIPKSKATVHIVMIDTSILCWPRSSRTYEPTPDVQFKWIEEQLKNSLSEYLIVAGHHPILSAGLHGNSKCLVDRLKPMLEHYKVTAYFSGHDHNLQHINHKDVNYFVSGNGNFYNDIQMGAHNLPKNSLKFFHGNSGGFATVALTNDKMILIFKSELNREIYKTVVKHRNLAELPASMVSNTKTINPSSSLLNSVWSYVPSSPGNVLISFFRNQENNLKKRISSYWRLLR